MCAVIAGVFLYLSFNFYQSDDITNALINGIIGIGFIILLIRNILKTKKERKS